MESLKKRRSALKGRLTKITNEVGSSPGMSGDELEVHEVVLREMKSTYMELQDSMDSTAEDNDIEDHVNYRVDMLERFAQVQLKVDRMLKKLKAPEGSVQPQTTSTVQLQTTSTVSTTSNLCFTEFKEGESITNFVHRLETFMTLKGNVDDKTKVYILLHALTPEIHQKLYDICAPENPKTSSYDNLVQILKNHLDPKPSVCTLQHKFISRVQGEEEKVLDFATELRKLCADCQFNCSMCKHSVSDMLLRLQFIRGLRNKEIRTRLLQEKSDFTFQHALDIASSIELSTEESKLMEHQDEYSQYRVHKIEQKIVPTSNDKCNNSYPSRSYHKPNNTFVPNCPSSPIQCYRCGDRRHKADVCKFRDEFCRKCGKLGHIQFVCMSKRTSEVREPETNQVRNTDQSDDDDDDVGSPHKNESTVQDNRFDSHYKTVNKSDEKGGYNKLKLLELEEEPYNMEMINKELDELENCEFNTKQTVPESQDETTNEEDEHFFKFESKEHFVPQKIVRKEDSDHEVPRENVNTPTQNIKKPTNTSLERPQTEVISQIQNDTFRRDVPENGSASGSFNTKTTRKLHQVPTNEEIPNHSKMNPANQIRQEIPNSDTSELSWMNEVLKVIPTPQTSTDDFVPNKSRYGSSEEEINKLANLMNGMTHDDNNNETNSSIFQDEKKITGIKHDYHARSSRPISEDDNDNDTDFRSVFENKNTKNKIRPIISFNSQETSTQGIQSLDDSSYNKTQLQVAIQMTKEGKTNRKSQDTGELQYVLEHLSVNPAINKTDDTHMEIDQMSQLTSQQKEIQTEMTAQTMKNILKSTVMDMNIFDMTTPTLSKDYIPLNRQENQMKTPRNVENQDIEGTSKSAPSTSKSSMRKKRKTNSYPPLKLKGQNVSRPQLHSNKPSPQLPSNVQKQKYSSNGEKNPNQKSKESTTLLENITKITSQLNVSKKEHSNMMKALEEISLAPTAWSQSFKPPSNTREILNDLSTEDENTSKEMEICEMISSKGFKSNQELSKVKELTRTTVSSKEELSKITGSSNRTTHVINDPDFEPNHSISITSPEASISSLDLETELYLSQQISSDTHATKDKPAQFKSEQFKEIQFEDSPPEANVEEDNKTKIGKLAELMSIINDVVQYSDESTKNDTQLSVMQTSKLDSPWKINEENKALAVKTQIADLFNQPENSQSSSNSNEFLLSLMMNKEDSLLSSSDIETRSTFRHNFDLSEESTVDQEISHRSNRSVSQRLVTASPYPKKLRAILHTDESETSSQGQSQKLSRRQKYKANKLKSHMDNSNMNSQASTTGEHYDTDNKLNIDAISKKQQNSQSSTRNSQVSVGGRWTQTVDNILLNIKKKK
uniref:CCHC-type domain-containing protein n=1 Tax=Cacopsylla melanoneura TaxID=428564 RepID=A0A8D9BLT1_9HEMI